MASTSGVSTVANGLASCAASSSSEKAWGAAPFGLPMPGKPICSCARCDFFSGTSASSSAVCPSGDFATTSGATSGASARRMSYARLMIWRSRSVRLVLVMPSRLSSCTNTLGMFFTSDSMIGSSNWRRLSSVVLVCLLSSLPDNSARSDSNFRRSFSAVVLRTTSCSCCCISSICWVSSSSIMSRVWVSRSGATSSPAWASSRAPPRSSPARPS